jgi:hypothetical protein
MIYMGTTAIPRSEDNGTWSLKQAAPKWNGNDGDSIRVNCFTNCEEAELFLNGQSLGKRTMADAPNRILWWNTVYHPGELIVKGYKEGKEVAQDILNTTGKVAAINAIVYKDPLIDAVSGVQQIEVILTDDKGQRVYDADNTVTVRVTGSATLLGIENSDANYVEDYHAPARKAKNGVMIVYIQPTDKSYPYEVNLESPGLGPTVLTFNH